MSNHVLKGTLLGGFRRSDVIEYIERSAKENSETVAALKEELEAACKARDGLAVERDFLLEKSGCLDALQEEKSALTEEVTALRTAKEAAERENAALQKELECLRPEVEEYRAIRSRLSEIQIEACRRASELEENTRRRMQELEDTAYERLQGLTDRCRAAYDAAFVAHYPEVFDELDQLLQRGAPQACDTEQTESCEETE